MADILCMNRYLKYEQCVRRLQGFIDANGEPSSADQRRARELRRLDRLRELKAAGYYFLRTRLLCMEIRAAFANPEREFRVQPANPGRDIQ